MRFIFIFILLVSAPAMALQAAVVGLTANNDNSYCSASVVKSPDGRCRFFTAAHCADLSQTWTVLNQSSAWNQWLQKPKQNSANETVQIDVQSLDRVRDLVELPIPKSVAALCANLSPFTARNAELLAAESKSVGLFGVLGKKVHAMFVDEGPWPQSAQRSTRNIYSSRGIEDLQIDNVRAARGMSGGPVVDSDGNFLGVFKKYVPRDDVILVATTQQIQDYLNGTRITPLFNDCKMDQGRFADARGNSHANGGGNSHGNGGGTSRHQAIWNTFKEPSEGILNPHTCGSMIIGKGNARIDGVEDFERLLSLPGEWIERPLTGFPAEALRMNIFDRFEGTYVSTTPARQNISIVKPEYIEIAQGGIRDTSRLKIQFRKTGSNFTIDLAQDQGKSYSYQYPSLNKSRPPGTTRWVARLIGSGEKIEMVQEGHTYTCRNDNFLKIICETDVGLISFSKSSVNDPRLKIRYTRWAYAKFPYETDPTRSRELPVTVHLIGELEKVP